jgi:hypothetical protein
MLRRKYGGLVVDVLGIPQIADVSDAVRSA